jgi:hypothetical protein
MPQTETANSRDFRQAFRVVLSHYDEVKATLASASRDAFYCGMGYSGRGVLKPCASDFTSDVEVTVRRTFAGHAQEAFFFKAFYTHNDSLRKELEATLSLQRVKALRHSVQTKLGKAFMQRGIYPVTKYMESVDLR